MSGKVTSLAPLAPAPKVPASPYDCLIRRPGQLLAPDAATIKRVERIVQRFLRLHQLPSRRGRVPRTLVIDGQPGVGKTTMACDSALRLGWNCAIVEPSLLASRFEAGATEVLDGILREAERISLAEQRPCAVILDDADLGIIARDDKTSVTANHRLMLGFMQALSTDPTRYICHGGGPIPLMLTGNDFRPVRTSLLRNARADWFTLALDIGEREQVANALLKPRTPDEVRLVQRVHRRYRNEDSAFWRAVASDLDAAHLDRILDGGGTDIAALDAALEAPRPLNSAELWALAKARARRRTRGFLSS